MTVTATDDGDDYADAASLTHAASGGGYDGVTKTLAVAVAGGAKVKVGGAGETAYRIGGRTVTVKVKAGVPAGIELDLAALPESNERLTLIFAPEVSAATLEKAALNGFGGLAESDARTVVDVRVTEGTVRSPGLRLCLPVEEDVRDAARDRPLLLLHYDGNVWEAVGGEEGTHVCAPGVMSFSPFAVGYADTTVMVEVPGRDDLPHRRRDGDGESGGRRSGGDRAGPGGHARMATERAFDADVLAGGPRGEGGEGRRFRRLGVCRRRRGRWWTSARRVRFRRRAWRCACL